MAGDSRLSARFGSDTTDFKNGIAEINRELKVVESGFRASASAMGDWSDSATGLEMRIGALNGKIDLQREKVSALQVAYEQQVQAHGAGSAAAQNAQIALNKETETLNKMEGEVKETTEALNNLGKQTQETGNQAKESESKWKSLGDMVSKFKDIVKNVAIVVAGVAVAVKKALDFGAEGAKIVQLEESFGSLTESLGASTDVLERMQAATRGTVDDTDLMAATMKALTGTSEDLSRALLNNSPALLEIAKASNKLNPTMGSTLELYEALSTSIKNLTPRGLKQVGIVIDTTTAYEAYAKSVGKTKDALTEEEQSMALLNAVLDKGQDILQQVGGNTESATDRFERANVAIDNLKENIQIRLMPVLGEMASGLNLVLGGRPEVQGATAAWGAFFNKMVTEGKSATEIVDAYNQKQAEVNKVFNTTEVNIDKVIVAWIKLTQNESKFLTDQSGLQQALLLTAKSADEYAMALLGIKDASDLASGNILSRILTQILVDQARAQYNAAHAADAAAASETKAADATTQQQKAAETAKRSTINLAGSYNTLASAAQQYGVSSGDLADIQDTLTQFVYGLDDSLNTTSSDIQLMADATALGIVGATDYAAAMYEAANGIQIMSDAERESLQASVASEQAKRNQTLAVQAASQSYLDLASSLKGATSAQIAETAIQGLSELQKAGKIDFSTYFTAVSGLQESFGLSDEKSRALAAAMPILNDALVAGVLPATNYDDALKAMIKDAADGIINIDGIMNKFFEFPASVTTAVDGLAPFDEKMTAIPESAATSAQGAVDAFTQANWEGAGIAADNGIAKGITAGTPAITDAVKAAIQAAINAANASGATGPTMPTVPGYASGGYGQVPPGYPNDSYLVGLTSGEEFYVGALARAQQNLNAVVNGMNMTTTANMTSAGGAGAVGGTNITIASGAIVVNASAGMDEEAVAQKVIDRVGSVLEISRSKGMR